ncbi:hypothetical protein, partial [uncultured Thomasclavelia sp.]|uniref:hypothetical protein n=1 Tax=uncultured Thomasclavelia sp. TaxID=3025759 RepID=UPI00261E02D5
TFLRFLLLFFSIGRYSPLLCRKDKTIMIIRNAKISDLDRITEIGKNVILQMKQLLKKNIIIAY